MASTVLKLRVRATQAELCQWRCVREDLQNAPEARFQLPYFCKGPVDTNFEDLTLELVLASTKDMLTCAAPQSQGVTSLDDGFLSIEAAKNVAFYLCRSDHGEH